MSSAILNAVASSRSGPAPTGYIVSTSTYAGSTNATSHVVTLPTGRLSGDYCVIFLCVDGSNQTVPAAPSGWTRTLLQATTTSAGYARYVKTLDGTEGNTLTFSVGLGGSEMLAAACLLIRDLGEVVFSNQAQTSSSAVTTLSWNSRTTTLTPEFWVLIALSNVPRGISTNPTTYDSTNRIIAATTNTGSATGSMVIVWWKADTSISDDSRTVTYDGTIFYQIAARMEFN
jgi:hypothetical protein